MTTFQQRWAESKRTRQIARRSKLDQVPPPPSAFAAFGEGSTIVPPARILTPSSISIGSRVAILEHAFLSVVPFVDGVTPQLTIGDRTRIGRLSVIACVGEIVIEEEVLTADRIFIGDTSHGYTDPDRPVLTQPMTYPKPVRIGRGSFLGIGSVVLPGVTLGEHAYVAAGAVVSEDVAPFTVVVGNPARPVRRFDTTMKSWVDLASEG